MAFCYQTYLGYKTRSFKIFGFGPELVAKGHFSGFFRFLAFSPYTQKAPFKLKIIKK
jgi:hypothetical protein